MNILNIFLNTSNLHGIKSNKIKLFFITYEGKIVNFLNA